MSALSENLNGVFGRRFIYISHHKDNAVVKIYCETLLVNVDIAHSLLILSFIVKAFKIDGSNSRISLCLDANETVN